MSNTPGKVNGNGERLDQRFLERAAELYNLEKKDLKLIEQETTYNIRLPQGAELINRNRRGVLSPRDSILVLVKNKNGDWVKKSITLGEFLSDSPVSRWAWLKSKLDIKPEKDQNGKPTGNWHFNYKGKKIRVSLEILNLVFRKTLLEKDIQKLIQAPRGEMFYFQEFPGPKNFDSKEFRELLKLELKENKKLYQELKKTNPDLYKEFLKELKKIDPQFIKVYDRLLQES